MGPEIIAAIVTSSTALVAAILSVIISLKTLKLQRKISNSPLQIDYLTRKLIFLENLKKEFIDMDHKVYGNNPASLEKLKEMEAESTNDMLTFLSQTVDKLKGFLFNDKFYNVDNKIQKIKRYNSLLNAQQLVKDIKPSEDFSDIEKTKPIFLLYDLRNTLKDLVINEISNITKKIENIIKINAT